MHVPIQEVGTRNAVEEDEHGQELEEEYGQTGTVGEVWTVLRGRHHGQVLIMIFIILRISILLRTFIILRMCVLRLVCDVSGTGDGLVDAGICGYGHVNR